MSIMKCRQFSQGPSRCVTARARRRVSDYSARRAGGEEENRRRSRTSRDYQAPLEQRGYQNGTGGTSAEDYSSRRSGGQEENQRRSRDFSGRNGRQPLYDEQGMGAPSSARVSSAASSPRTAANSPRATPRRGAQERTSQSPPPWNPPSPSRDTFDAYSHNSRDPPGFTPLARKQSGDYASRRSGNQEENIRRSQDFVSPRASASSQPRSYMPDSPSSSNPQAQYQQSSPRGAQPPVMRKPSTDYSSRRSGGQEENERRSGDYRSPTPTPRRRSPSSYSPDSPLSSQSAFSASPRNSQPSIARKRSTDYPSRRAGGQEENQRRSGDYTSPTGRGSSREPATRYDYTPPRTRGTAQEEPRPRGVASQDFVPLGGDTRRKSGGYDTPRSSSTNYSTQGRILDENSPPTRAGRANAERRRSGDYSERRSSSVSEENSRRRSVDMITGQIREPSREGPPPGRRMAGGYDSPASSASYNVGKKIKGVPRESKDFVAASDVDPWQKRLNPASAHDPPKTPVRDGPSNPADTDWPRVIAGNLPAAFLVFAGIAAVDVSTGFDITRLAVRYGGPGAPPTAVLAFWPTAIAAAGVLSTVLTSLLSLEAFGLKAKCPECNTVNRAGFKGVLGHGDDAEISRVECENCMADLRFDLPNKKVVVERGSEEKKREALERGRQQALRIARMEAEVAQREAQQYTDHNLRGRDY